MARITRMSGEQPRFDEFRRALSIRWTHIDYHYAFYRIPSQYVIA